MERLIGYGAYIPYFRLQRSAIAAALGSGGGKGARAVASFDEDATSMGVEAARGVMRDVPHAAPATLTFATANPPYLDKTNATAIHAALGLDASCLASDAIGSVRSGAGAMWAAVDSRAPSLVVLSDLRTGTPGSTDETNGGDAAAALLFGDGEGVADVIGRAAVSAEFLDRWRMPSEDSAHTWEERFGEHVYVPLARDALDAALKDAGIAVGEIDHLIVAGLHARAVKAFAARAGVRKESMADDLTARIGNTGVAQPGVLLASVLDVAKPNETIALVVLADGATAFILRTTPEIERHRASLGVARQIESGRDDLGYTTFLTWRGMLDREPPRRPDPVPPAPAPSYRMEAWKFAFTGSRCTRCGTRHLPPARVCVRCGAIDEMEPERLADLTATVATFTIDRLAYTLSPPLAAAVLDFDGGGRFNLELTDIDPSTLQIGDRMQMTFRRITTAGGVHNYFWKARLAREPRAGNEEV